MYRVNWLIRPTSYMWYHLKARL